MMRGNSSMCVVMGDTHEYTLVFTIRLRQSLDRNLSILQGVEFIFG